MIIEHDMNVSGLAAMMGHGASVHDAKNMRELLCDLCLGEDTEDIPSDDWLEMLKIILA